MWHKFARHRFGVLGGICFLVILIFVLFPEFTAPYDLNRQTSHINAPPQLPRFIDDEGRFHFIPFVYGRTMEMFPETGEVKWTKTSEKHPIRLFVKGEPYQFLFIDSNIHLFGAEDGYVFLLGTDNLGRDLFTRILYGGRISLAVATFTAFVSVILGVSAGLVSGYLGGTVDLFLQRVVEFFLIIPAIPLALALAGFLPPDLSPILILFGLALILSIRRWASMARQIRGKALGVREEEFVLAAMSVGASTGRILYKHILPPIYSHIIVIATLTLPSAMIMEAGLSFLGFGIRPPMTSWGLLLKQAQSLRVIELWPWRLMPGIAITITVLSLNFVGDAIRDLADPYSQE